MSKEDNQKKKELDPKQKEWADNLTWIQCMNLWLLSDSADDINYEPLKSYFFSTMARKEREETKAIHPKVRKWIDNMSYPEIEHLEKMSKLTLSIDQRYIIHNYIRSAISKYETAATLEERAKHKAIKLEKEISKETTFINGLSILEQDEQKVIEELNNLDKGIARELQLNYKDIPISQAINYLKKKSLDKISAGEEITSEWIQDQQEEISNTTKTNSFIDWTIPRIYLGFFIPYLKKVSVKSLLNNLHEYLQYRENKLRELATGFLIFENESHFSTASLCLSFYNKTHPSSATAKQLLFRILPDSQVQYGLSHKGNIDKLVCVDVDKLKIDDVVAYYKNNVAVILRDEY
ncbi:hypothetical protein JEZ13_05730 [bacterium]|nr:hypothetical protein [bacterium]